MQIRHRIAAAGMLVFILAISAFAQADPSAYAALQWRLIGPFRAGRVTAVSGVPGDPSVYYMATPNGGIWKTTDGGRVWLPIFDCTRVASVGAVAVSPSQPNIIYAGTGEQGRGNGVYKSSDAGATWTQTGLAETHYIANLIIDPRNPEIVLVAADGDREPGPDRGVYRTTNGGKTWTNVLFRDNNSGAMDIAFDSGNPREVFATLQQLPPEPRSQKPPAGPGAWIYRSRDEGATWQVVPGQGLPQNDLGRIGVAVAPATHGRRVFAIMNQGLFRSDDAGNTWRRITTDPRIIGNGYFSRVFVDPMKPDIVYVAQTSMYRSDDGGQTFHAWYGAPSGDDVHVLWINPRDTRHMLLGVDQGAIVSRDGGHTWSSWFNQPTGQFYTVTADNQFPYWVYAAQQDSGTVAVPSRSDFGEITSRDWYSPGGFEVAHILADPLNPRYVYSSGWYGTLLRLDRRTMQVVHVFDPGRKYRTWVMPPIAFSPQDPHTLYLGAQKVLETGDSGVTWHELSPDLTRGESKQPAPARRPVNRLTALAPSPVEGGVLWAGSGDGLIHVTRNGGSWQDATPPSPAPAPAAKASQNDNSHPMVVEIEASHFDPGTAYAVLQVPRQFHPYILRTHDFGHSWSNIVRGLPAGSLAWAVREDPQRKGLLYAGTETGVFVSFDDGEHWQALQLNLPVSPVRDLAVHGNDLVAATFGRALWILDNVAPLRQLTPEVTGSAVHLFPPAEAVRVRWDVNQDTPLPKETPAGANPPDGAIIDYFLKTPAPAGTTLEIDDAQGHLVRKFTTTPELPPPQPPNAPQYWFASQPPLSMHSGLNRFVWNLRYPHPHALTYGYFGKHLDYFEYTLPDHAIPGQTPRYQPRGPLVVPGKYEVVLTVNGRQYRQPFTVSLDPRVPASIPDLQAQLALEQKLVAAMNSSDEAWQQVHAARTALVSAEKGLSAKDATDAAKKLDTALGELEDGTPQKPGFGPLNRDLGRLLTMTGTGDARPAATLYTAAQEQCADLREALGRWQGLNQRDIPAINALLQKSGKTVLPPATAAPSGCTP